MGFGFGIRVWASFMGFGFGIPFWESGFGLRSGNYECCANNSLGSDSKTSELIVLSPPDEPTNLMRSKETEFY